MENMTNSETENAKKAPNLSVILMTMQAVKTKRSLEIL